MVDQSDPANPINLFESGSILLYLAEKHQNFIPPLTEAGKRAEVVNWLMWQMGSGPYFGQFGHFYKYAPADQVKARDYGVGRYGMEVQRCLSVLDMVLAKSESGFIASCGYSIADMAIFPWVACLDGGYGATEFLSVAKYEHVADWAARIAERPAVKKALTVTPFK